MDLKQYQNLLFSQIQKYALLPIFYNYPFLQKLELFREINCLQIKHELNRNYFLKIEYKKCDKIYNTKPFFLKQNSKIRIILDKQNVRAPDRISKIKRFSGNLTNKIA